VKAIREIIPEDSPLGVFCFEQHKPRFDHDYHHHPEIEITSIRSSTGQYLIGDATGSFEPGDLFILGTNLPHRFKNWTDGVARSRVLQFREATVGDTILNRPAFTPIRRMIGLAARGLLIRGSASARASRQIDRVFRHREQARGFADFLVLLETLSECKTATPLCGAGYASDPNSASGQRLARVLSYIDSHWHERLSLASVAHVAALHPQSFSRFFRRHLGLTFQAYLVQTRVGHVARRLIESDASVTEIALASGFDNMANFHRHFKRAHGTSPLRYRQRFG